jgi:hypothetical protein
MIDVFKSLAVIGGLVLAAWLLSRLLAKMAEWADEFLDAIDGAEQIDKRKPATPANRGANNGSSSSGGPLSNPPAVIEPTGRT